MSLGGVTYGASADDLLHGLEAPDHAFEASFDERMPYLDTHAMSESALGTGLDLRIVIIGAGPAGLVLARNTARFGAQVTVLEQAGDPRGADPGYTNRSFNITLDVVGRQVLDDQRAWAGGIWIYGRALHHFRGSLDTHHTMYGNTSDTFLVSIPRPVLRQNLCMLAEEAGAQICFRSAVTTTDTEAGLVFYTDEKGQTCSIEADLIVFGDGLHSMANDLLRANDPDAVAMWPEHRDYITGTVPAELARGYSKGHVHFWHEQTPDTFTVGIPNHDGSLDLLIASPFADLPAGVHPFEQSAEARRRLQRDFPRLYTEFPHLAEQLPSKYRGSFCYKAVRRYRVGSRGVLVGDASLVFPPWAGYGANKAMYTAASLAYALTSAQGVVDIALEAFQNHQQRMAAGLIEFGEKQGDFLAGSVKSNPAARSQPGLALLIKSLNEPAAAINTNEPAEETVPGLIEDAAVIR
ncbi:MAG TPA: NAD(P)/FAD-dependent oxidoreductase [Candidatus Saccharimonadales bacterium]|nr:NAD(P)/FAD-dependent oxidoreductase [Candidatus Saccharimonadales bacterium]